MNKINRLKCFRIKNNITQQKLSSIIGCSQATISHIEQNYYPTIHAEILYRLKKIGLHGSPIGMVDFNNCKIGAFKKIQKKS